MAGPTINRGSSEQVVETPDDFIAAVETKFGPLAWDLAALDSNHKAPQWVTPTQDSFTVDWHTLDGLQWLNCEFGNIAPWAKKCAVESQQGAHVLLLVPGSIGANWYWEWVEPYADVYSVGRMVFKNCYYKEGHRKAGQLITDPYPKDLILCDYNNRPEPQRMRRWPWRETGPNTCQRCPRIVKKETVLCPPCGRTWSEQLDIESSRLLPICRCGEYETCSVCIETHRLFQKAQVPVESNGR